MGIIRTQFLNLKSELLWGDYFQEYSNKNINELYKDIPNRLYYKSIFIKIKRDYDILKLKKLINILNSKDIPPKQGQNF